MCLQSAELFHSKGETHAEMSLCLIWAAAYWDSGGGGGVVAGARPAAYKENETSICRIRAGGPFKLTCLISFVP